MVREEVKGREKGEKRSWSKKLDANEERKIRREKRHKRMDREKWEAVTPIERERHKESERMIEQQKARRSAPEDGGHEFEGFA